MKKYLAGIFAAMFTISLLCSCTQPPAGDADAAHPDSSYASDGMTEPVADTQMVSSTYMIDACTSSDSGFYQALSLREGGQNIVYTDFETKTRVYLCNRADCSHDNESCTSWFAGSRGLYLVMNLQKTKIFIFRYGNPDENMLPQIMVMDPNGANRKTLIQFPANERHTSGCAADNENLYFAVDMPDPDGGGQKNGGGRKKELRQVNMETGAMTTLLTFGPSDWLVGAFEDQLVIAYLNLMIEEYIYTTFSLTTKEQSEQKHLSMYWT